MNAVANIDNAVLETDQLNGLSAIHQKDCPGIMWRRQKPHVFESWLSTLAPEQLPKTRLVLRPEAIRAGLQQACDLAGTPQGPERDELIKDITGLADVFATLMDAPYLRLRLDVVTTNACRRFHIDAITARLVCTYRGTGTQYGFAAPGSVPDLIHTVPTGAPILLRGTLWPPQPDRGFLHRSPPIEGTGEVRLVLVLDPMTTPEEEI